MLRLVWLVLLVCCSTLACSNSGNQVSGHDINEFFQKGPVQQLAIAAAEGDTDTIAKLVASSVDINFQGKDGMTALMWALGAQNKQGFRLLLENGANPNLPIKSGGSVMSLAASADDAEFLQLALKHGGDPNLFNTNRNTYLIFETISPGHLPHVKALVEAGAEINSKDNAGQSPMIVAANLNQYDIVLYLLNQGADFSLADRWGYTVVEPIENNNIDPDNELYQWRQQAIGFLREQGVTVNPRIP